MGWLSSDAKSLGAEPRLDAAPLVLAVDPFILEEVPDLRMPDFLTVFLMPTLWVVEAPIEAMVSVYVDWVEMNMDNMDG